MKTKVAYIPQLDGLRGCAAGMVFLVHFFQIYGHAPLATGKPFERLILWFSGYGSFGVDVFFVLSGFLITSLLLVDRSKGNYFHNFYWKRALRIMPIYLIHLLLVWWMVPDSNGYILLSLLFIVNFDGLFHVSDVGPAWTLSIEEQFYLMWPQVIRRLSMKSIYRAAIFLIVASVVLRAGLFAFKGSVAIRYTFYRCDGLGLGSLLALQWMEVPHSSEGWVRGFIKALNSRAALYGAMLFMVFLTLPYNFTTQRLLTELFLVNFLVYRTIRHITLHPQSLPWFKLPPLRYLGNISYSMYMIHTLILVKYDAFTPLGPMTDTRHLLARLFVTIGITLAACTLLRYGVELPAQRLRRFVVR